MKYLIMIAIFMISNQSVYGCDCDGDEISIVEAYNTASKVFVGTNLSIVELSESDLYY